MTTDFPEEIDPWDLPAVSADLYEELLKEHKILAINNATFEVIIEAQEAILNIRQDRISQLEARVAELEWEYENPHTPEKY